MSRNKRKIHLLSILSIGTIECNSVLVSHSGLLPILQKECGARRGVSKEDHIKDSWDRKEGLI